MKKLFTILFTLVAISGHSQLVQTVINLPYTASASPTSPALLHKPNDYATATSTYYPLLIFLHGAGESGTNLANIYNSSTAGGPAYFIEHNGWPASFTNPANAQAYKFLVVSPQRPGGWSWQAEHLNYFIQFMVINYRVDPNKIYITGLSAGGEGVVGYAAHLDLESGNPVTPIYKVAAFAPMSAAISTPPQSWANTIVADSVRAWGFGSDPADIYGTQTHLLIDKINIAQQGFGRFTNYSGGHCCWNTYYNPTYRENIGGTNMSIYEWMLQYTRSVSSSPTSNAGPDQTINLPVSSITLSGSGTAGSGYTITSYGWTKISGPAGSLITNPSSASTTVTGLVQGTYIFRLTVTNNVAATATDDVQITVNPVVNIPPIANAGPDKTFTLPANSVTLTGSGTDPDGTITAYLWSKIAGPAQYTIVSPTQATTIINNLVQGVYQFELKVTDNQGATGKDTVVVTGIHPPPTVTASGNQTITLPASSVSVTSTNTVHGSIISTKWTKFKVPGQSLKKIVVLGSSTSVGTGTTTDSSYVERIRSYYLANGITSSVVNLANVSSDIGAALPTGTIPMPGLSNPDPIRNVTAALTYNPDVAIVNFPSNAYNNPVVTPNVVGLEAQIIYNAFIAAGVDCYITTTQSRNEFFPLERQKLKIIRDTLLLRFGTHCINFWDGLTDSADNTQLPQYANGDGIHFNDLGHERLFQLVRAKNIFQNTISSPSTITTPDNSNTSITGLTAGIHQFQVSVIDADGLAASSTMQVTVNGSGNQPPVANAGPNQNITLPTNSVTLTGSGSDPDGTITAYLWSKIAGPAQYTIVSPTQATTVINNLVQGVYQFELRVTDNQGATGRDTVVVTVNAVPPPNQPPVANAGTNQTIQLPTNQVTLNGTGSYDPDGTITTYAWVKNSGPPSGTITTPSAAITTVTGLTAGIYVFQLTVTDNNSATNSDLVQITVNNAGNGCGGQRIYITPNDINGIYGGYYISGAAFNPGDTLVVRASLNPWSYFGLDNMSGTASCPIVVINEGGQVLMKDGIGLSNCEYIKILGTGSADQYGFKIQDTAIDANGVAIAITRKSRNIEVSNIFVNHKEYGCWIKNEADCDTTINYPNWTLDNISVHHCYFRNMDSQGFYMGSTDPNNFDRPIECDSAGYTVTRYYTPTRLSNIKIYNNLVDSTGRPGIQLSAAMTGSNEIYNNTVRNSGFQFDDAQGTGISLGGYTRAYVHDNIIRKTYTWGIAGFGSGLSRIENNNIDSSGFLGNQSLAWPSNIFFDTRITIPVDSTLVWIRNNILGTPGSSSYGIVMEDQEGTFGYANIICNNLKFNGQPATLFINPSIHFTTNCSPPPNQPPVANAGPNQNITLPTNTVTLTGSGTDPDGIIAAYLWSKIAGPAQYTIVSPTQATTVINNLVQGVYQFELMVTDNLGATGRDTVVVTVNPPPNQPPVANAGPNQNITLPTNSLTLTGSGTDPDGTITAYQWSKIAGPAQYTIVSPTQATTVINNLVQGVYQFELMVTDNLGATGRDTVVVTVNPAANQPPVANAGPNQSITLPTNSLTLTGSGTDPDGTITAYQWSKIAGPAQYTIVSPTQATTVINNLVQGVYQFELRVTDNLGATGRDTVVVTVNAAPPPPNQPPVANAGPDQTITLPTSIATLTGSGSDPDGTIASYVWTQISGTVATIVNPSSATTNITGLTTSGARVFRLTVTDNNGATAIDDVTVTVNPAPNQPPIANAGLDQNITLPTSTATLIGSGSDPDGTISSYAWTQVSGTTATIVSPSSATTNITGLTTAGVRVFRLTVTDNNGVPASDDVTVTVNPAPNQPPVANAGPDQSITLPTSTTTLIGSGSDPDGTISSYAWTQVSGTVATIASPSSATTNITGLTTAGVRVFRLTVTDNNGATASDDVIVTVNPAPNQPPVANAGPDQTITLPTSTTTLTGSGSDPDGTISSYAWTQVSGTTATIVSPSSATTNITGLTTTGIRVFRLTVTDNNGATATDDVTVTVNPAANQSPIANAGTDQVITLPTNSVTLTGSGTDPDGTIVSYQWSKVAGPPQYTIVSPTQAQTVINNLQQGIYQFELMVTDNQGATGRDTVIVTVSPNSPPPNQPPVANAGSDQNITLPTNGVVLTGSGTDPDGIISSYQWSKITGPPQYTIVSPTQAQTVINNLQQGVYQFELMVTDNQGATGRDTVVVTVNAAPPPPPNQPPVANAGPDQIITLPTNGLILTGSGTDPDGIISSYQWSKIAGPPQYTIVSPTQAQTVINNLMQGIYQFELMVTDNQGATGRDTVIVTVNSNLPPPPNQPPVANAGPDKVIILPTNGVVLTGSGTDPDGIISSYQWSKIAGPPQYTIVSPTQAQTVINNLQQGIYQFELMVTDNQGATGRDTVIVTVSPNSPPPNQPPVANAGSDQNITLPTNGVVLTGSGTDPDGIISSYQWSKITGPPQYTIVSPTQAQTVINNLQQGVYQFELMVTDNQGATGRDTVVVTVNAAPPPPPNQPPVANAGPDQIITLPTNGLILTGSGTDPDGIISSYQWSKIAGPPQYTIVSPTQAQTVINNLMQGIYQFELMVTDNQGATGRDTVIVTVNSNLPPPPNQPPVANAGPDKVIILPTNGVVLTGSGTDPDGIISSYQWSKIAGPAQYTIVSPTQATTVINNLVQGIYQFELMVTDNLGATGRDTVVVTVNAAPPPPPNQPPVANAGPDKVITLPVNGVTLAGSGTDPDGIITAYQWSKIAGPTQYTIVSPTQATTVINNLVQGIYQFELMVTDNLGATGRDTVIVTVNPNSPPPNQPPAANAGPDQVITLPVNGVILTGSGTDPDGIISSYLWSKIAGPAQYTIVSPTQATTVINNLVQGIYQFELRVTDNQGATGRDTVIITVNPNSPPPNQPPAADAGSDKVITLPVNGVTLQGSGADPDGIISSYLWSKIAGPAQYTIVSPTQATTVINNLVQGIYQFELMVTDNQGATGRDTVIVTVNPNSPPPSHQPPVANAGLDQNITLPVNNVTLTGSGTADADVTITAYRWSKIAGPAQYTIVSPTQATTVINNLVQGVYQFELMVTDNLGATGRDTVIVTVNVPNQAPVANAGPDQTMMLPTNSTVVNGSGTDADGIIISYSWSKISGPAQYTIVSPTQATTVINNLVQGVYQFELKVTDNYGATGRDTLTIIVFMEEAKTSSVRIFPNPATTMINVEINAKTQSNKTNIRIYDPRGTIVYQEEFMRNQPIIVRQIDVSKLAQGFYLVKIAVDTDDYKTLKLIKQ